MMARAYHCLIMLVLLGSAGHLLLVTKPSAAQTSGGLARIAAAIPAPAPHPVHSRVGPQRMSRTVLVPHAHAPFPYDGLVPSTGKPFMDPLEDGRRGRRIGRGRVLWEDETFSDRRVLLHIPGGFDVRRPGVIVVFFHGHGATLETDVATRQQLPRQIGLSGSNAVLVAPQLAVNAADSSIGKLWQPDGLARLLDETSVNLATLYGDPKAAAAFQRMPVVIVAYSGGYVAAAWSAHHGGLGRRLTGILLLDALYGEADKLAEWIGSNKHGFLVSAYTGSTRRQNEALQQLLAARRIGHATMLDERIRPGAVAFLDAGENASHRDFVTEAWTTQPVGDLLARLPGHRRGK